jgi:hypothetical protein
MFNRENWQGGNIFVCSPADSFAHFFLDQDERAVNMHIFVEEIERYTFQERWRGVEAQM